MNNILCNFLAACLEVTGRHKKNPAAATAILNDLYGPALKVYGAGKVVVSSAKEVTLTVHGRLKEGARASPYFRAYSQTIDLRLRRLSAGKLTAAAKELEHVLAEYVLDGDGAHVWIVPDGYLAELTETEKRWERGGGGYFSHEALCVQNTGRRATRCELLVYFEAPGHETLRHAFEAPPGRSIHLRLDKLPGVGQQPFIPKSAPVGYKLISRDAPVIVQGSRILTSGRDSEFASFGTTMAWTPL